MFGGGVIMGRTSLPRGAALDTPRGRVRAGVATVASRRSASTTHPSPSASPAAPIIATSNEAPLVDQTLNPILLSVRPSKTVAFSDMASALKEQGVNILSLSVGEPDFDTPQPIVQAGVDALLSGKTRYTPNAGSTALRTAICKKLREENGLNYKPEEIVVSNGAKQAIWQAILSTCSPGDEVIVPAPYWVSYTEMATMAYAQPVIVQTTAEEGFILSPEKLKAALTPKSRLLILCSPSNPTGCVYTKEQLEAIAEVIKSHPRLMVLSDEIYEYIVYKPAQHFSIGALPGMHERTLTVNGFSKGFAMTGWRLGYLAAPRHFIKPAALIQSQSTSCASSIAQNAGLAALSMGFRGGEVVGNMVNAFEQRKTMIAAKLRAIPGVKLVEPQGAFYVLPEMSAFFGPGAEAKDWGAVPDSESFCMYLMHKAHVAVVPGEAFGAPDCIRISYAMDTATLEEAINRICKALDPSVFKRRQEP